MDTQYILASNTSGEVFVQITAPKTFKDVYGATAMLCKLSGHGFGHLAITIAGVVKDAETGAMVMLTQHTAPTCIFDAETITYKEANGTQRRVRTHDQVPCVVVVTVKEENQYDPSTA